TKTNLNRWLYTGSSWNLAAGMYFNVDRYKIAKRVNFEVPFCSPPVVWIRERQSACLSFASPNDGYPYAEITNVTETGFDVTYCTYYVRYNSAAQEINRWAPATISNSKIAYTAVGEPNIAATAGPISGPTTVCTSNTTFTINNLPASCASTWRAGVLARIRW
ncbi:MAG: H-type lectin domain-containing protein, partial [Candidatus Cloacimonetes bacterium]|nr:H-type lectin domain-containing protein [Candidatus Cloacimonadota bacterium]